MLAWISADVLHLEVVKSSKLVALVVATLGALLFGGVLGTLQWQVISLRVPVPQEEMDRGTASDRRWWAGCS